MEISGGKRTLIFWEEIQLFWRIFTFLKRNYKEEELAGRAILLDGDYNGTTRYILPPPMAGFFEFSIMRTRGDIDTKSLSELFYQYLNVEEDFIRELFLRGDTQLGRVFVQEEAISAEHSLHVVNYERATDVIKKAKHMGVSMCCCEAMIAARNFAHLFPVHTSNFLPRLKRESCTGCGRCVSVCPVESLTLVSANDPEKLKAKKAKVLEDTCLGCGVCEQACGEKAITMYSRPQRVITPVNSAHKSVVMAIERGMLQNLIFDNQAFFSHRAMAAILGVILRLPPIKQAMASKQMKSRYLDTLLGSVIRKN